MFHGHQEDLLGQPAEAAAAAVAALPDAGLQLRGRRALHQRHGPVLCRLPVQAKGIFTYEVHGEGGGG